MQLRLIKLAKLPMARVRHLVYARPAQKPGIEVRNMRERKTLIAVLAASLTLAALGLGAGGAGATTSCQDRYYVCMARCPVVARKCVKRCHTQYHYCVIPRPYLGDVINTR
jgi:hypothetical protein